MVNYLELPVGEKSPEVINAVIEIPAEGINKYEYDKTLHVFRLDPNLYSPVHYPGDYGFIPSPLVGDGKGWHDAAYARDKVIEAVNRFKDKKVSSEVGGNR